MENRVLKNNGYASKIKFPSDYAPATFTQFLSDIKGDTGVYADVTPNNNTDATIGNVGVNVVGTALNKDNILSDSACLAIGLADPKTPSNAVIQLQNNINGVASDVSALKTLRYAQFLANAWQGTTAPYTQTASVAGLLSTDNPSYDIHFDPTTTSASDALAMEVAFNCITKLVINAGSVTAYCFQNKPITSFSIVLKGE